MESITLFTYEVDDIEAGIRDLLRQLDDFTLRSSSVGLLFAPYDVELELLTERLKQELDFPIVGATGMSLLNDKCGYQVNGLSLQIMTADDCDFAAGITGPVTPENLEEEVTALCARLKQQAGGEAKVAITYLAMSPEQRGEHYLDIMERELPGVPLFGGVAIGDFSVEDSKVLLDERLLECGAVMVLVSGAVRPVMHCEYSVTQEQSLPGEVVCEADRVLRLGGRTLVEVLKERGIRSENTSVLMEFASLPFVAEIPMENGDVISVVRHLKEIDEEDGSGAFIGAIRNGTHFSIGMLEGEVVCASVERALQELLPRLEQEKDYHYSTILCTSCAAREMALAGAMSDEGDALLKVLPGTLTLSGMYSFGEICPVAGQSGKEYNMFHNTAFTVLVM